MESYSYMVELLDWLKYLSIEEEVPFLELWFCYEAMKGKMSDALY